MRYGGGCGEVRVRERGGREGGNEKGSVRRRGGALTPRLTKALYPGCTRIFEVLGVLSSFLDTANQEQREHRSTGRRFE
jgi:hypothetical protein